MSTPRAEQPESLVETERYGAVAVIYLNRPARLNAVTQGLTAGLVKALDEVCASDAGAVVLAGRGRAFCAGHDLREPSPPRETLLARLEQLQDVTRRLRGLPQPVIAAVHGHVVGAGVEFLLGCDLVLAAIGTTFRFPEIGLGLSITGGASKLLPLAVGPLRTRELLLLGEPFSAEEAAAWGIVNRAVPAADLMSTTMAWATRLAGQPRESMALAKSALNAGIDSALAAALTLEVAHAIVTDDVSPDATRSVTASKVRNTRHD
jgi:2-(1,2-epoxy-1,2-dihydrophenyl)acetyl-CoA isomerase